MHEKRKDKRVAVHNGIAAVVNHRFYFAGEITDISEQGLAVKYTGVDVPPKEPVLIDIMIIGNEDTYFRRVPGKVICTCDLDDLPDGARKLRRCGFKFHDLPPEQKTQLHGYIDGIADFDEELP